MDLFDPNDINGPLYIGRMEGATPKEIDQAIYLMGNFCVKGLAAPWMGLSVP